LLTPFGIVLELLVVKEELFTRSKDELVPTIDTLQNPVDELHVGVPSLAA
jgi:hypothetical protein